MDDGTFPLEQLARRSGVPVATLRRWRRVRLFPNPQGKGRAARYDQRHLLRARVVKKLRQAGQPLLAIRSQLERLSEVELQALLVTQSKVGRRHTASSKARTWRCLCCPSPGIRARTGRWWS
jgi:DNA-binding transcriptional MerR regulator